MFTFIVFVYTFSCLIYIACVIQFSITGPIRTMIDEHKRAKEVAEHVFSGGDYSTPTSVQLEEIGTGSDPLRNHRGGVLWVRDN